MELSGKVAIVTGAASGLGAAVADVFLDLGVKVACFDRVPVAKALDAALGCEVDVTSDASVANAVAATLDAFGAVHICINCAGIASAGKTLDRQQRALSLNTFAQVIDTNVVGTFNVASQVAQCMALNPPDEGAERGVIINTASAAAFDGQMGQAAYAASKGAIVSMSLPMARDLASIGIRVNAIAPGIMATPLLLGMPEPVQQGLVEHIEFPGRMGAPEEFAGLCRHIVENAYINAECIRLDGALRMSAR